MNRFFRNAFSCLLAGIALHCSQAVAQDLEPRRWSHLPTGINVLGLGLASADGDVLVDPAIRLEDVTFEQYILGLGYVYSFEWLGKSTRVDVKLPYASGRWQGLVNGEFASTRRHGMMDPSVRLSMNLYGAPPLGPRAYAEYQRKNPVTTTVGAAVSLRMPLGEYYQDRLINLGSNRWVLRPQLGVLHKRNAWQFELTGSVFLFGDNRDFFMDSVREQDPLWFVQSHVTWSFRPGWWTGISGGFAHGSRSKIDGVSVNDDTRSRYLALHLGYTINRAMSIKATYLSGDTNISTGTDSDTFILGWSMNWFR